MSGMRLVRRSSLVLTLAVAALGTLFAAGAAAHVSSDPAQASGTTDEAGITTVVLTFDHGCGTSPTTGLRVQLPAGTTDVTLADPDGWTSAVTDDVAAWTGGSIPTDQVGRFELRARLVGTEGDVLYLKTVQLCPDGELAWIEVPPPGGPEPENVAPSVTLSRTVAPASSTSTATAQPSTTAAPGTTARGSTGSSLLIGDATAAGPAAGAEPGTTGLIIFIVVIAVIVGGALVLYLRHRPRPGNDG